MAKAHRRKAGRFIPIVLLLLAVCFVTAAANYFRPIPALTATKRFEPVSPKPVPMAWPSTGEAAVGAVGYGVLSTNGTQTEIPTASVAKLITALVVLQKYPLKQNEQGPTLTLTASDVALYQQYAAEDGSRVVVQAGEQITEYQALQAMLLPSANNIADSLAIWAFGSLTNYSSYANQYIRTIGLDNTQVGSDASGFLPNTISTAHDLVLLGLTVLKNPVLAQITTQPEATLPVAGTVYNVNSLIGTDGIIGIKTGNSDQAGGVYLVAAQDVLGTGHTITIVSAVQGLTTLQQALSSGRQLIDSAKENFSLATVVNAGQTVGTYRTAWNTSVTITATTNAQISTPSGVPLRAQLRLQTIKGSVAAGSTVGTLTIYSADSTTTAPVALSTPLPHAPILWRIFRH